MRARDLGIVIGTLPTGPLNTITLVAAETMVGRDGITFVALPHDRLMAVMHRYGRGPR